jgi:hypothetical protein
MNTGEANWRIEDGALVADKGKGGLRASATNHLWSCDMSTGHDIDRRRFVAGAALAVISDF